MANAIAKTHAPLGAVTILHAVDAILHRFEGVVAWHQSRKTRQALEGLSDAQLYDIGLNRGDIAKF